MQAQDVDRAQTTTHPTQAGGGGAAVASWEPGIWEGEEGPPGEHPSLWGLLRCLLAPLKQLALGSLR